MVASDRTGTPASLDVVVEIAHDGIAQMLVDLAGHTSTPGVLEHLRQRLEVQLARGPIALRDAVAHKVDDELRRRLDDDVAAGRALADRVHRGEFDDAASHDEILDHLRAERDLAGAVVAMAGADAAPLADGYGRARDAVVYGL